ncbi:MAG: iron-containing alcohol dehydrogenase [Endomicrobium sp.]|nr:iron-containing alcohol dehydrogenase [Endomicrobium sp.]
MNNFVFCNPTRIIFGKNTHHEIGKEVEKYSKNILLHYGGNRIKKSKLYDEVVLSLKKSGIAYTEFSGVKPNPKLSLVREGIKLCRKKSIDFILAIGGGSVIDSAKAISMGVNYDGDVWDFFMGKVILQSALKVATILTLPAAGSESSPNSVITNEISCMKLGYGHDLLRPVFSILNPELCFSLPKEQIANGVCDMMAHIFERYFTNTKNTELSDKLCESILKTIINNALKVINNCENYNAWAELILAGNLAHNGFLGMGRTEDWASHSIEHAISAIYDIAHGAGLAIIFPAWMKYVYKHNTPLFTQFAVNVWNVNDAIRNEEDTARIGIEKTEIFFKNLGLPTRLSEINVNKSSIDTMAKKSIIFGELGNLKKLCYTDIVEIYKLAF